MLGRGHSRVSRRTGVEYADLAVRLSALLLTAVLVGAALPPALAAEPDVSDQDRDSARALAKAGIALYQQGRHQEAIEQLSSAEKLFHAPAHLLYMARAHAKLGQLVVAHRLYVDVESEADSAKTLGHVSTAMFVVGGVAAATGIVLLLVPSSDTSAAGSTASPALGARLGLGTGQLFGTF